MIIAKAIELLKLTTQAYSCETVPDLTDAIKLGLEALIRIDDVRLHPFHPVYSPLPGESMPKRGIR